ncbi:MAG TPA: hydroxyisourate hydrolase [Candidatus Acidoferrum sp.]|nr:hydroxyisourate hydrolase [Candidatus Acidoferrum sp.]
MSATLSTHVLDIARGVPAAGIEIVLYAIDGERRTVVTRTVTDDDGRTGALASGLHSGMYELVFAVAAYFGGTATPSLFDTIPVRFRIDEHNERYHVPLLLSPWGYSTYRGS